ncbi:MAG: sigma factor-like helix-turn-helix DNA-binding protein [Patescibacteria group bacterium]
MADSSILDRIITQRHVDEMRSFDPVHTITNLFSELTDRERSVLTKRYGVPQGVAPATLEHIGLELNVTRERIRQIARSTTEKVRILAQRDDDVKQLVRTIEHLLRRYGGAVEEFFFINEILTAEGTVIISPAEKTRAEQCLRFLLEEILNDVVGKVAATSELKPLYVLVGSDLTLLKRAAGEFVRVLSEGTTPLTDVALFEKYCQTDFYAAEQSKLVHDPIRFARQFGDVADLDVPVSKAEVHGVLMAYVAAAAPLDRNIFGEWGFSSWPTVRPRRMNDKIYLILKHEGKPLHFTEISARVNAAGFDKKVAKPPSVHNELILDKRFVLVGRGTYALREWGYRPGTVSDVIVAIVKEKGALTREQLVSAVLARRIVKQQTIHLALLNRSLFEKDSDGRYTLVEKK